MTWKVRDEDYLDLWKYFEDRADNVKEAMFTSVTWTVGFAAAIFGFIFVELVDFQGDKLTLNNAKGLVGASLIGILLCAYSVILILESKKHIVRNWDRAKYCKRKVDGLDAILGAKQRDPRFQVWNQVLIVVVLLMVGFGATFIWAIMAWKQSG